MKHSRTSRGFELVEFTDHYGKRCSLQQSSLAIYQKPGSSAVWLGTDDADPKVMWKDAICMGVPTNATEGWVPYPIPPQVSLSTRMHLNRKQVKALIVRLQHWLNTGSFKG